MQFNGVGRYGGCTGSLLDTESENGPAYILTNGHCVGRVPPASKYAPPKGAYFDISQDSNKSMTFNYFKDAQNSNFKEKRKTKQGPALKSGKKQKQYRPKSLFLISSDQHCQKYD